MTTDYYRLPMFSWFTACFLRQQPPCAFSSQPNPFRLHGVSIAPRARRSDAYSRPSPWPGRHTATPAEQGMGVSTVRGRTPMAGWFLWTGKSHLEMDDDLGYSYFGIFGKPPGRFQWRFDHPQYPNEKRRVDEPWRHHRDAIELLRTTIGRWLSLSQ